MPLDEYKHNLEVIVAHLRRLDSKLPLILITPPPVVTVSGAFEEGKRRGNGAPSFVPPCAAFIRPASTHDTHSLSHTHSHSINLAIPPAGAAARHAAPAAPKQPARGWLLMLLLMPLPLLLRRRSIRRCRPTVPGPVSPAAAPPRARALCPPRACRSRSFSLSAFFRAGCASTARASRRADACGLPFVEAECMSPRRCAWHPPAAVVAPRRIRGPPSSCAPGGAATPWGPAAAARGRPRRGGPAP